jgi:hypothetical protein
MPRDFTHRAHKVCIVGQSGHGKSVYQMRAAIGSKARYKFVFDHKGEFKERAHALQCGTPQEIEAALPTGWVVYNPNVMYPGKMDEAFIFFCDFAWQISEQLGFTKLFVADEVNLHTNGSALPEFCRIMEDGRSVGLDALITSHGVNSLHNRIRGQVNEIVTFYHNAVPALDKLWEEFGINPDHVAGPMNERTGEREGGLKPGEFIAKNMESRRYQGGRVF